MIFNALHDCPAPSTCPGRIGKAAVCHGGFYVCSRISWGLGSRNGGDQWLV